MSEINWDELIDRLLSSTESPFVNLSIAYARQNLRNAIERVEQERDEFQKERDTNYSKFIEEGRKFHNAIDKIVKLEAELKEAMKAINYIADLGLQNLPVDKRWGTAHAIVLEAIKRYNNRGG